MPTGNINVDHVNINNLIPLNHENLKDLYDSLQEESTLNLEGDTDISNNKIQVDSIHSITLKQLSQIFDNITSSSVKVEDLSLQIRNILNDSGWELLDIRTIRDYLNGGNSLFNILVNLYKVVVTSVDGELNKLRKSVVDLYNTVSKPRLIEHVTYKINNSRHTIQGGTDYVFSPKLSKNLLVNQDIIQDILVIDLQNFVATSKKLENLDSVSLDNILPVDPYRARVVLNVLPDDPDPLLEVHVLSVDSLSDIITGNVEGYPRNPMTFLYPQYKPLANPNPTTQHIYNIKRLSFSVINAPENLVYTAEKHSLEWSNYYTVDGTSDGSIGDVSSSYPLRIMGSEPEKWFPVISIQRPRAFYIVDITYTPNIGISVEDTSPRPTLHFDIKMGANLKLSNIGYDEKDL